MLFCACATSFFLRLQHLSVSTFPFQISYPFPYWHSLHNIPPTTFSHFFDVFKHFRCIFLTQMTFPLRQVHMLRCVFIPGSTGDYIFHFSTCIVSFYFDNFPLWVLPSISFQHRYVECRVYFPPRWKLELAITVIVSC